MSGPAQTLRFRSLLTKAPRPRAVSWLADLSFAALGFRALGLATLGLGALTTASGQSGPAGTVLADGKMWSTQTSTEPLPWAEAETFCETLETGGHRDWRLPNLLELEALHDPATETGLPAPLALDDCCAWSAQNLAAVPAEQKGQLPNPSGAPNQYYWGFLFSNAVSYYSNGRFADGSALCVRDAGGG